MLLEPCTVPNDRDTSWQSCFFVGPPPNEPAAGKDESDERIESRVPIAAPPDPEIASQAISATENTAATLNISAKNPTRFCSAVLASRGTGDPVPVVRDGLPPLSLSRGRCFWPIASKQPLPRPDPARVLARRFRTIPPASWRLRGPQPAQRRGSTSRLPRCS